MVSMPEVTPANFSDFELIIHLLNKSHLPTNDVSLENTYFLKAVIGGKLVGAAGVQMAGNEALLRSMTVDSSIRSKGIGQALLEHTLAYAKKQHVKEIYLITTTAQKYFENKGFTVVNRTEALETIQHTTQLGKTCSASAIVMRKKPEQ